MSYSSIGILAAAVLLIINYEILLKGSIGHEIPAQGSYRRFLVGIVGYYITDIIWGVLNDLHLTKLQYIDTVIYFVAMALALLFWTQFVVGYLNDNTKFEKILFHIGRVFLVFHIVSLVINLFVPIVFWFDENGVYHAAFARYVTLGMQIVVFFMTSVQAFFVAHQTKGGERRRHLTIGAFGVAMSLLIAIQIAYPLLPLYSIGCMLGTCLLHTFVFEDEKEEYRRELEESLQREQRQVQELNSAWRLAYTDPLTGVKSKLAYLEQEEDIDKKIIEKGSSKFAVGVFDLNGLKTINDVQGHEFGDKAIIRASQLICEHFKHSPVFRVGGDEFVVILTGQDFVNRDILMASFDQLVEVNQRNGGIVVSAGLSEYKPDQDDSFESVFRRADSIMYKRKQQLKSMIWK